MAIICFDHPSVPSAGTCQSCGLGLCVACADFRHPPVCRRCFAARTIQNRQSLESAPADEIEAIQSRAAAAAILGALGALTTWSLCNLFAFLGIGAGQPWGELVATHDFSIIGLGAYVVGSAPYGWFIAGGWLVPPDRFGPLVRAQAMRSATLATIAVGPFFAPAGIIHDVRRLFELRGKRRPRASGAIATIVTERLPNYARELPSNRMRLKSESYEHVQRDDETLM
jgi:hypothetical protein